MAGNLCERRLHGWIHRRRRGLPRHNRSSAVVRRLYIHEAPRCCDQATLQWKSVRDCGAIQKNAQRCKNRTKFRKLRLSTDAANGDRLGQTHASRLTVGERTQSTGGASGMFISQHEATGAEHLESVLAIVCRSDGRNASARVEQHLQRAVPGRDRGARNSRHHAGPAMAQAACPHRGPTTGGSGHARSRAAAAPEYRPAGPLARHAVAFGPRPGTPREKFCGFIDPRRHAFFAGLCHLLAMVRGSPMPRGRGTSVRGRLSWPKS